MSTVTATGQEVELISPEEKKIRGPDSLRDQDSIFSYDTMDQFKATIWDYYNTNGRIQPWRHHPDPYHIVVSEMMLQQTQVRRVIEKYPSFITRFPGFHALATAELTDILEEWQGLGYNRRARYLKLIAQRVVKEFHGLLPDDKNILITFPGIGYATASSIAAFAFNKPVVFIETNIRRVFIHFFFSHTATVSDAEILPFVTDALDTENPREWYYALMDYGTMLGKKGGNPNKRSTHYTRQSSFEGSDRQLRGKIIRFLLQEQPVHIEVIISHIMGDEQRMKDIILGMERDGIIISKNGMIKIA